MADATQLSQAAVLLRSAPMPEDAVKVKGYDFNQGIDHDALLESFARTGFQATSFGQAVDEINRMVGRQAGVSGIQPSARRKVRTTIFLGYTSNMISSGVRETIRFLVQHKLVDAVVTTAGGVEEDFIKCMADTYVGDFHLSGTALRKQGINRIGNLLVPNDNYVKFEQWMMPILDQMLHEQQNEGVVWSPSTMIRRFGKEIDNEESVYYWAYKNDIPVFCPAITDGSIGDMIYFHSVQNPGLIVDLVADIRAINYKAEFSKHTGMVILGGGLVKHHICNANLMRNGADHAVFINTAQEFDGSDAGARPDEAISWGKIRLDAKPVKIYGEASMIFPLLVAQTFARRVHPKK
ncbi:uncharacterized protein MONBRDRAFT_15470 [Monosiga brevicollis MX1]|uniref:deoxyhypusine synthase n=1 Tax=Monosiga brevicollis TaxID=81824 RepID=A9UV86_MONBE|nr:uncharacterized protein MONBRDRAFT_15470 [Monosiga brevicollis MX1]EDQ91038.1 predicted protein [Monosiga brevicollis MX1]|eukprot:XP_001744335.1 hypothetical protein [Monosiga brevicollis MX1]